jgi:hypothetical protein
MVMVLIRMGLIGNPWDSGGVTVTWHAWCSCLHAGWVSVGYLIVSCMLVPFFMNVSVSRCATALCGATCTCVLLCMRGCNALPAVLMASALQSAWYYKHNALGRSAGNFSLSVQPHHSSMCMFLKGLGGRLDHAAGPARLDTSPLDVTALLPCCVDHASKDHCALNMVLQCGTPR